MEFQEQTIKTMAESIGVEVENQHDDIDLIKYEVERRADNFRILGRTMEEWLEYFTIRVTYPASTQDVMRYCSEFVEKSDKAYRAQAKLNNYLKNYLMSYSNQKSQEISRIAFHKGRKVMPAADTLEKVADSQMGIRNDIVIQYQKDIDFFQSMIYKLNKVLESVKTIGMSQGTQLKGEMGFQA